MLVWVEVLLDVWKEDRKLHIPIEEFGVAFIPIVPVLQLIEHGLALLNFRNDAEITSNVQECRIAFIDCLLVFRGSTWKLRYSIPRCNKGKHKMEFTQHSLHLLIHKIIRCLSEQEHPLSPRSTHWTKAASKP